MADSAWDYLKKQYGARRKIVNSTEADQAWITGPRHQKVLEMVGKNPIEAVDELRKWYDDNQEDNE